MIKSKITCSFLFKILTDNTNEQHNVKNPPSNNPQQPNPQPNPNPNPKGEGLCKKMRDLFGTLDAIET